MQKSNETAPAGCIGSILINLVLLFAAHNVLAWDVPFITSAWSDVLWAIDLSLKVGILVGIMVNVVYLAYDGRLFRRVGDLATTACALVAAHQLYLVYPFAFGAWDPVVQLGLFAMQVAMLVALVVIAILVVVETLAALARFGEPDARTS